VAAAGWAVGLKAASSLSRKKGSSEGLHCVVEFVANMEAAKSFLILIADLAGGNITAERYIFAVNVFWILSPMDWPNEYNNQWSLLFQHVWTIVVT